MSWKLAIATVVALALSACGDNEREASNSAAAENTQNTANQQAQADNYNWMAAPPVFPAGAQMAVLHGDPTKSGTFVVRLKFPANY